MSTDFFFEKTGKPIHVLLKEFRSSLKLSQAAMCKRYKVGNVRLYRRWESSVISQSGPNLKKHPEFILDFFKYLSGLY